MANPFGKFAFKDTEIGGGQLFTYLFCLPSDLYVCVEGGESFFVCLIFKAVGFSLIRKKRCSSYVIARFCHRVVHHAYLTKHFCNSSDSLACPFCQLQSTSNRTIWRHQNNWISAKGLYLLEHKTGKLYIKNMISFYPLNLCSA